MQQRHAEPDQIFGAIAAVAAASKGSNAAEDSVHTAQPHSYVGCLERPRCDTDETRFISDPSDPT